MYNINYDNLKTYNIKDRWKKENLEKIIKNSKSKKEIFKKLGLINGGNNFKTLKKYISLYNIDIYQKDYCKCGNLKSKYSKVCSKYNSVNNRKIKNRPSHDILKKDIEELGYCGNGRKYGVSDNAVRKWIKNYEN